jgi:Zn-finger nucleic acid-binding protein
MPESTPAKCPRCDQSLTGSEQICPGCRRPLAKTDGLISAPVKAASCPVCKIPVYPAILNTLEILHCAECEGLAIRREMMMKIQPQGKKEIQIGPEERNHKTPPFFEPRQKPPFLICPFCGKRMEALKLGKTELDQCEKCGGVWLEGPKLEMLQDIIGPYKYRVSKPKDGHSRR